MGRGTGDMIYVRKCRRHYGISASQLFSSFRHANEEYYEDQFDGEKKARQQMEWLIKKGDALLSNQTKHVSIIICRKFGLRDLRKFRTTVFACELDDAPKRLDLGETQEVAVLNYDLTRVDESRFQRFDPERGGRQPYLCVYLTLEFRLGTRLECSLKLDDDQIASVSVNYQ